MDGWNENVICRMDDGSGKCFEGAIRLPLPVPAVETVADADAAVELLLGLSKVLARRRICLQEEPQKQ